MSGDAQALAFLPSLIAVEQRAPHPAARATAWLLLGLFAALLLWVCFGQLDIVAVAEGKLVPATYLKIVQPAEGGIAKQILVREGETVEAGQVLARMDAVLSDADRQAVLTDFQIKRLALRRIDAQLAGAQLQRQKDDPPSLYAQALAQYNANRMAYENQLAQERSAVDKARHELAAAEQVQAKLEQILPHFRSQEAAYLGLGKEGFAGQLMVTDKVRERVEKEQELKTQLETISAAKASVLAGEQRLRQVGNDYQRQLHAERADVAANLERLQQELAKQDHRHALTELKAPQAGTVKDLATHTAGTVVQPGTVLMTLVPRDEPLKAEVWVNNEDAGFVREGLTARVKLAAYPFQKYGMLDGRVDHLSADAQEADRSTSDGPRSSVSAETRGARGAAYRALIDLGSARLPVGANALPLSPGMQVSAELSLGRRTVLEYLLSPVQKAFSEAGRER